MYIYMHDESKMSVAHCSVGRIAPIIFSFSCHLFWFAVLTLMVTLQQPKKPKRTKKKKIQPKPHHHYCQNEIIRNGYFSISLSSLSVRNVYVWLCIFMHHSDNRLYFEFCLGRNDAHIFILPIFICLNKNIFFFRSNNVIFY